MPRRRRSKPPAWTVAGNSTASPRRVTVPWAFSETVADPAPNQRARAVPARTPDARSALFIPAPFQSLPSFLRGSHRKEHPQPLRRQAYRERQALRAEVAVHLRRGTGRTGEGDLFHLQDGDIFPA